MKRTRYKHTGFGLIETVVAMGLLVVFLGTAGPLITQTYRANRLGDEQSVANAFAQEGLEAARSIKNQNWLSFAAATGVHGATSGGGTWAYSGTSDVNGKYTRVITVSQVMRDINGNIDSAGCAYDPDIKKVDSTVTWQFGTGRPESVTQSAYLGNFRTSWRTPALDGACIDLFNDASNAVGIAITGDRAFVARSGTTNNFVVLNISTTPPTVMTQMNLANHPQAISPNPYIVGSDAYVFVASDTNTAEIQAVKVTNYASGTPTLSLAGSYDAAGNQDATSVFNPGNNDVYLGRLNGGNFERITYTPPNTWTSLVSAAITGSTLDVFGPLTGFGWLAGQTNTGELQSVNLTTSAVTQYNYTGNDDGSAVTGYTNCTRNRILLGRINPSGDTHLVDAASPTTPLGTYGALGFVADVVMKTGNKIAFLAVQASPQFRVLRITGDSTLSLFGSFVVGSNLTGVNYSEAKDRAYVTTTNTGTAAEVCVLKPT